MNQPRPLLAFLRPIMSWFQAGGGPGVRLLPQTRFLGVRGRFAPYLISLL